MEVQGERRKRKQPLVVIGLNKGIRIWKLLNFTFKEAFYCT